MAVARRWIAGLACAGLLGATAQTRADETGSGGASSAEEAAALVTAMSRALRVLNYEGIFVHLQGPHVSSLRIVHANDGEGELERMTSLDGEAREVIRDHSLVTCIWPGSQSVVVSKSKPRRLLPNVDAALARNPNYAFALAGTDRVAGLPTDVVEIRPRDAFRYGYRFWIDSDTHMLLRSMLLDGEHVLEQVLFTAIEYPQRIDRARFEIDVEDEHMSWIDSSSGTRASSAGVLPFETPSGSEEGGGASEKSGAPDGARTRPEADASGSDRVLFENLPAGYAELTESYRDARAGEVAVSHVMLSDGMASVSIYVEHARAEEQDTSVAGLSSMGAMNAYGLSLEQGFVTAVGEVPPGTVRAIAESVRLSR